MRKLILSMGGSLDGMVARPKPFGAGGWGLPPEDPALKLRKLSWMDEIDLHLMGRNTYEEMAARMSVPLGTMKSWIRRAIIKLKSCLEQ